MRIKRGLQQAFLFTSALSLLLIGQAASFIPHASASTLASGWWDGSPSITQDFGCESTQQELSGPANGCSTLYWHSGIDLAWSNSQDGCNVPLYTPVDGAKIVAISGGSTDGSDQNTINSGLGPNYPTILMPDGNLVLLGHVNPVTAPLNTPLPRHTLIATVGKHGYATGCHLHFEVRPAGTPLDAKFADPSGKGYAIDPHVELTLPGGTWNQPPTPADGTAALVSPLALPVSVHAQDYTGSGLNHVNITWEVEGTNQWSAQTKWFTLSPATSGSDFSYNIPAPVGGWPSSMIISFDVYANNGQVNFAPQGMRRICLSGRSCTSVTTTPPVEHQVGGGGSSGGATSVNCVPGQYQVSLFEDQNFGGSCVTKDPGTYNDATAIGLPDKSISSVKIGSGAQLTACDNPNINSYCQSFTQDNANLANTTLNTDTISSVRIDGNQPTTGCNPGDLQVSFFVDPNWSGTCITKDIGTYNDAGAIGLPDNSISSILVGAKAKVRACDNPGMNSYCQEFDQSISNLASTTLNTDTISSANVYYRGGISLCGGTNYGGPCKTFGTGKYNLSDYSFSDMTQSVQYDPNWSHRYHIVLWSEANQTGNPAHYDDSVADIGSAMRNHVRSINIYANGPPNAIINSPASGTILSSTTTSVTLNFAGGDQRQVHVWGPNLDTTQSWSTATSMTLNSLVPGAYSWQVEASDVVGQGDWSPVQTFSINTPPAVTGGQITVNGGTSTSIQVQATDAEQQATLALSAANLPSYATFTDNGGGVGTLTLAPSASENSTATVTITANDGELTGTGQLQITVQPVASPPSTVAAGTYKLINPQSGKALDISGGGTSDGTPVQIWDDNGTGAQKWQLVQNSDGTYKFINPQSGKALDISGGGTSDGTRAQIWDDNSTGAQQWAITQNSDGTYKLINPQSGKALDISGGGTSDGTPVQIWDDNGTGAQEWQLVSVDGSTPPPDSGSGTELLSSPWNLSGDNGASELYQSIDPNALVGKTTVRVTYNLHGLQALGNDASALIFDQNGWHYVSLSGYGQNGLDGPQTVDIPLSDFGLDLSQPVGTLHTRFWYGSPFTVDITSVKVL